MAIVNTRQWLEKDIQSPLRICRYLKPYFDDIKEEQLYEYLKNFGMYNSVGKAETDLQQLINENVWIETGKIFSIYKNKWGGPDIPIFIIPHRKKGLFSSGHNKSGLAYPDKLLLFLSPGIASKEREALFIHEYHHVCRLSRQDQKMTKYTITESCVLEGLAEYTVKTLMGEQYLAPWIKQYSNKFLEKYWLKEFESFLTLSRKEQKHEQIMYGRGKYPFMIGYCMGYYLVQHYYNNHDFSIKSSFSIEAETIIQHYRSSLRKEQ